MGPHPVDPSNPNMEGEYEAWRAYRRSKLANLHSQLIGMSTKAGARPQIRAAVDPAATGGQMYAPRCGIRGAAVRRRYRRRGIEDAAAKLWQLSVEQTGVNIDIDAAKPLC